MIDARRQYFYFLNVFLGITGKERHWTTHLDTDLDLLLPFKRIWISLGPAGYKNYFTFAT